MPVPSVTATNPVGTWFTAALAPTGDAPPAKAISAIRTSVSFAVIVHLDHGVISHEGNGSRIGETLMIAEQVADVVTVEVIRNALNAAAHECRGCDLYKTATQVVFGDRVFCAHQGYQENGKLFFTIWNRSSWSGHRGWGAIAFRPAIPRPRHPLMVEGGAGAEGRGEPSRPRQD